MASASADPITPIMPHAANPTTEYADHDANASWPIYSAISLLRASAATVLPQY